MNIIIQTHPENNHKQYLGEQDNNLLKSIISYLFQERGFDSSVYRLSLIERRTMQRLYVLKCKTLENYIEYLQKNDGEIDNLIETLTINTSTFFRDTLTFDYIAEKILPAIVLKKIQTGERSLRIWSNGCSTGEEPYSIAILVNELMEQEGIDLDINIFATDIDTKAMDKGKKAVYPFESIKNVRYMLLKKYFSQKEDLFELVHDIRSMVSFSCYNILDKKNNVPPVSVFGDFDMVLCKNVLIYFHRQYQDKIFHKLYHALSKGGYLILGEVEKPLEKYIKTFKQTNGATHIYQKI